MREFPWGDFLDDSLRGCQPEELAQSVGVEAHFSCQCLERDAAFQGNGFKDREMEEDLHCSKVPVGAKEGAEEE